MVRNGEIEEVVIYCAHSLIFSSPMNVPWEREQETTSKRRRVETHQPSPIGPHPCGHACLPHPSPINFRDVSRQSHPPVDRDLSRTKGPTASKTTTTREISDA